MVNAKILSVCKDTHYFVVMKILDEVFCDAVNVSYKKADVPVGTHPFMGVIWQIRNQGMAS